MAVINEGYQPRAEEYVTTPPNVTSGVKKPFAKNEELRPCYVDGKKALFHKLYEKDIFVCTSLSYEELEQLKKDKVFQADITEICRVRGGFFDNKVVFEKARVTVALVEDEWGALAEVAPNYISFVDTTERMKQYSFEAAESEGDAVKVAMQKHIECLEEERKELVNKTRAEAIKEYMDRLKEWLKGDVTLFTQQRYIMENAIEKTYEEIRGEQNEDF